MVECDVLAYRKLILITAITLLNASCISIPSVNPFYEGAWNSINEGEIKGNILIEWIGSDKFKFIPTNDENTFTFIRKKEGKVVERITPNKVFYTDGGSIPQFIKFDSSYSSWKYAPAYIIHDWLFEVHQCGLDGGKDIGHEMAAKIMAEVIKTQLINEGLVECKSGLVIEDKRCASFYNVYKAVGVFSKNLWDDKEKTCDLVGYDHLI